MTDTSSSFWKKKSKSVPGSIKQIYGAQHPPIQEKPSTTGSGPSTPSRKKGGSGGGIKDAFEAFKNKTDDAWDDGEDDIMITSQLKMSLKDVQNTALQVMQNHSASQLAANPSTAAAAAGSNVPTALYSHSSNQMLRNGPSLTAATAGSSYTTAPSGAASGDATGRTAQESRPVNGRGAEYNASSVSPTSQRRLSISSIGSAPGGRPGGPGMGVRLRDVPQHWDDFGSSAAASQADERWRIKMEKFRQLLVETSNLDMDELRKQSWSGIPALYRPTAWKLLSGYLPTIQDRRQTMLERKRQEYHNFVQQYYQTRNQDFHKETYRQIHIDIPRMSPLIPLFQQEIVQQMFERILYIWAIRHPASGYVQGINDLVTPFFIVFLTEYVTGSNPNTAANYADIERCDLSVIEPESLLKLEADCFWCFSKLLDGIQDNYTFAQPGIQTRVNSLKDLISRIDNVLHNHLDQQKVEYLQFSFRWMNNMLMREMPLRCVIRLWDTYLSESDGFASFHLYVCAAFLTRFSTELRQERDFHGLMLMLQNLPTENWTNEEIGLLLAEAYRLKYTFADAPKHFKDTATAVTAH